MKKFLINFFLFSAAVVVTVVAIVAVRIALWQHAVMESEQMRPEQEILFMGDSHIGCTFVEEPVYSNRVIWCASLPHQFTLMRLKNMERDGMLRHVKTLVIEFGLQSIGQQREERMKSFLLRMLPICWRYQELIPLGFWQKAWHVATHLSADYDIIAEMPTANIPLSQQPEELREIDWQETSKVHFGWIHGKMCKGWERSEVESIFAIKNLCDANRIGLIVLTAPLTKRYIRNIPHEVESTMKKIVGQFQERGICYYDLRSWGNDDDFRDCFHFTVDGAKRFTDFWYGHILKNFSNFK